MPRCGCATACGCKLRVEPPLGLEGSGTARDEWVLSLEYKGKTGGEALAALLCDNLGPGLRCDEGGASVRSVAAEVAARRGTVAAAWARAGETRLMAKLSTDAGNRLRFGSDDGLLVTSDGDGPENPETCGRAIDSLPETGVTGGHSLAGLINPYNSPQGLQYLIANNIDVAHVRVAATADGVAWLAEYSTGNVSSSRSTIFHSSPAAMVDSSLISSTVNTCGVPDNPQPEKGGDNWYGWLAPQYPNWFLPEMLQRAAGKVIVLADCQADDAEGAVVSEAANVSAALRAGKQMCAQNRLFVGVQKVANAKTVVAQGFVPIMMPGFFQEEVKVGETKPPYEPSELTGAGVTWAALTEKYDDTVFEAYKAAGISVLMVDSSRQYLAERAKKVARGRLNLDPVYARGVGDGFDYRGGADPWYRGRMCVGQLSHDTDDYRVAGTMPRGYLKLGSKEWGSKEGLVMHARFGGGYYRPSILVGYRNPVQDPGGTYRITWDAQVETLPTGPTDAGKFGIMFGAEEDRNTAAWPDDDGPNPSGWPTGYRFLYRAYLRVDGRLGLGWWERSGEYYREETHTDAPKENQWMSFEVVVTPDSISLERKGKGGGKVTAKDNHYRGPYVYVEKEELHPDDDRYGFRAAWRFVKVTS